ncbi:hypothetical protein MUN77_10270 [Leucobacter allii]|uniref:ATP-binding protein n=1 Tax=Leucobacter allii TaxID=2932247 RepID=UPI001FD1D23A|nr:ATP-binding protein [Leucobacter allii]UOR00555.1 hypothetical protein MUN77_10270 [Leucobacter allii]
MIAARAHRWTPSAPGTAGWTTRSFDELIAAAQIACISLAQPIFAVAALGSQLRVPGAFLVTAHLAVALLGAVVLLRRAHPLAFLLPCFAILVLDALAAVEHDGALTLLLTAVGPLIVILPIMFWAGAVPVLSSACVAVALSLALSRAHPDWPASVAVSFAAAALVFGIGAAALIGGIRRLVAATARSEQDAARERQQAERTRLAVAADVEYRRVLHDTVVNTLGSLARDDAALLDPGVVRGRCARDLRRIAGFHEEVTGDAGEAGPLDGVDAGGAMPVRRLGMTDEELRRICALAPRTVVRALRGCVEEAVRNAADHSGATAVTLEARASRSELAILVSDDGRGFDGAIPPGRGLAESVFARAREHGIDAELDTAPGSGTRIALRTELTRRPADTAADASEEGAFRAFLLRLSWIWALVITGAVLLGELLVGSGDPAAPIVLALGVAAICGGAWFACRGGRPLPRGITLLALVAIPAVAWATLAGSVGAGSGPSAIHAYLVTPLLVLLLLVPTSRAPSIAAAALLVAAVAAAAVRTAVAAPSALPALGVAVAPLGILVVAWYLFHAAMLGFDARAARARARARAGQREAAAAESAAAARDRWNRVGLGASLELIAALADGSATVADPAVRARCAAEEHQLRQLASLLADAGPMNWWLALALAQARSRGLRLALRTESARIADPREAEALGRLVLDCVAAARAGTELVVNLFADAGVTRLIVVGDGPTPPEAIRHGSEAALRVAHRELGEQSLLEATWRSDYAAGGISTPSSR